MRKSIDKSNISLFGLLNNDNIGSSFCCNLVGENNNWGTFFTIDVYFFFLYQPLTATSKIVPCPFLFVKN